MNPRQSRGLIGFQSSARKSSNLTASGSAGGERRGDSAHRTHNVEATQATRYPGLHENFYFSRRFRSARRMSHHQHSDHEHHSHQAPKKWRIHHDWRFWAVIVMLVGMGIYVATMDEAIAPGMKPGPEVPAAAP